MKTIYIKCSAKHLPKFSMFQEFPPEDKSINFWTSGFIRMIVPNNWQCTASPVKVASDRTGNACTRSDHTRWCWCCLFAPTSQSGPAVVTNTCVCSQACLSLIQRQRQTLAYIYTFMPKRWARCHIHMTTISVAHTLNNIAIKSALQLTATVSLGDARIFGGLVTLLPKSTHTRALRADCTDWLLLLLLWTSAARQWSTRKRSHPATHEWRLLYRCHRCRLVGYWPVLLEHVSIMSVCICSNVVHKTSALWTNYMFVTSIFEI